MQELKEKAKLIISSELTQRVTYLHNKIGNIEWSGILMYSIQNGNVENPKEFVIKAENLWLMDVGTSAYTEYDFGPEMMDMYDSFPQADPLYCEDNNLKPWKIGHIHTHHNMNTFFSGTDSKELQDNAPNHNYYLSLIVNFDGKWCAKIAIATEIKTKKKFKWRGSEGNFLSFEKETEEKDIMTIDCDLEFEGQDGIDKRIAKIKTDKAPVISHWVGGYQQSLKNNIQFGRTTNSNAWKHPRSIAEDISPNQLVAFDRNEGISDTKINEYLLQLVLIGTNKDFDSLEKAVRNIDEAKEDDIEIWKEMVEEEMDSVFNYVFPITVSGVEDIAEKCSEITGKLFQSESALWLSSLFTQIHEEYELDRK